MKEGITDQEKLFEMLGSLKGIPQKYGQFLYLQNRKKYHAFEKLLDVGIPSEDLELYHRIETLTEGKITLTEKPIASASIGQVYEGTLNGETVIVKAQYPEIQRSLQHDWRFVKKTVGFFFSFFRFPQESKDLLVNYLQEFEETIEKETNYILEAQNLLAFKEAFKEYSYIYIPKLYEEYTRKDILVEEKCTGIPLKEFLKSASEAEKRQLLDILGQFYFNAFFQHHMLHGDPHSANFFVEKHTDELILQIIDFGCVKYYTTTFIDAFKGLIDSLRKEAYTNIQLYLLDLGFRQDELNAYDKALIPILNTIFEPFLVDENFDFKYWKLTYKLNTIMGSKVFEKTMSLPKDLLILFRVFHGFIAHIDYLKEKEYNIYHFMSR